MVDFSSNDIKLLTVMSVFIILISFVFPAVGFSADDVQTSDIPEYNITSSAFDFAEEFPKRPNSPSKGRLIYDSNEVRKSEYSVWLYGDFQDGIYMQMLGTGTDSSTADIDISRWEGGSVTGSDNFQLNDEGATYQYQNNSVEIEWFYVSYENDSAGEPTLITSYTVRRQPEQTQWYDRIPLMGSVVDSTEQLSGIIGWGISVVRFYVFTLFTTFINLLNVLYQSIVFLISLFHWIITTYMAVANGAPAVWASLILYIPGLVVFIEFAKIILIAVELIWIG